MNAAVSEPQPFPPGMDASFAGAFLDPEVVALYGRRPAYPSAIFDTLLSLLPGSANGAVLELGAGTGEIARTLAPSVTQLDAVDMSEPMLQQARSLPGGDAVNWVHARVEECDLRGPYDLAVAGDSLHWMPWNIVLPLVARLLAPGAFLSVVSRDWKLPGAGEAEIFQRYSLASLRHPPDAGPLPYQPLDMIGELERRGLFRPVRMFEAEALWEPGVDEFIESRHSQSSFPRSAMGPDNADAFDSALRTLVSRLVDSGEVLMTDGRLALTVTASVVWGYPGG